MIYQSTISSASSEAPGRRNILTEAALCLMVRGEPGVGRYRTIESYWFTQSPNVIQKVPLLLKEFTISLKYPPEMLF